MKGAVRIASAAGIPVLVHWSFGLTLLWVGYLGVSYGLSVQGILVFIAFILSLFLCVILHEFGHALTARRYGVETKDIILFPIGGVARLTKLPKKSFHELVVAIAGPLVNFAIAIILALIIYFFSNDAFIPPIQGFEDVYKPHNFLPLLLTMNLFLGIFNLVPAFPMDGGRILRALLAMKMNRKKATLIASRLGQALAILFTIYGFLNGEYILAFIGLFIFFTASQEYKMVKIDYALDHTNVREIMRSTYTKLQLSDQMALPIEKVKTTEEKYFLVVDTTDQIIAVLHEAFIQEAIRKEDADAPVAEYISYTFDQVDATVSLQEAFTKMRKNTYTIMPVYQDEVLVGVLDVVAINHFLKQQQ